MSAGTGAPLARATYAFRRLGWPFPLGLLLLLFALVFQAAAIRPAEERLSGLDEELARWRARAAAPVAQAPSTGLALPAEARLPELIRAVLDGAQKSGVTLDRGEYQQSREGGLLRMRMVLPVKAGYPQVRAWLADVMNGLPSAVIEEISLGRNAAADAVVEGKVRLTLYLEVRP